MTTEALDMELSGRPTTSEGPRARLLAGLPVNERRLELAGVSTAVLDSGDGPPVLLLHGPGEFGVKWMRVIPGLATTHRVIAPDLPAHGATEVPEGPLDLQRVLAWLGELIDRTCTSPPVLVGHVLGGALAARFATDHGDRLRGLVLVDSLGLGRFRPAPRFALTVAGFLARPTERSYDRFMHQCSFDLEALREQMGERWEPFVSYNLEVARAPSAKAAGRMMRRCGITADPVRGPSPDHRSHDPHLGPARPCPAAGDRRGRERSLRLAVARDRQLRGRPPTRPARGVPCRPPQRAGNGLNGSGEYWRTMSRENVEVVRGGLEGWNRGDVDAWLQSFHPEIEWFSDTRDLGDTVLAIGHMRTRGRASGIGLERPVAYVYGFDGGWSGRCGRTSTTARPAQPLASVSSATLAVLPA